MDYPSSAVGDYCMNTLMSPLYLNTASIQWTDSGWSALPHVEGTVQSRSQNKPLGKYSWANLCFILSPSRSLSFFN